MRACVSALRGLGLHGCCCHSLGGHAECAHLHITLAWAHIHGVAKAEVVVYVIIVGTGERESLGLVVGAWSVGEMESDPLVAPMYLNS